VAAWALRDPGGSGEPGAFLERLQLIKLSLDAYAAVHEQVVEVAAAEGTAGVDTRTCETHGEAAEELCAVWRDPDFDPTERALYYARVIESPTCRWSTWACNAAAIDCGSAGSVPRGYEACCDAATPKAIQERAWSSPIWYHPE
jgi:hypothetical protein